MGQGQPGLGTMARMGARAKVVMMMVMVMVTMVVMVAVIMMMTCIVAQGQICDGPMNFQTEKRKAYLFFDNLQLECARKH